MSGCDATEDDGLILSGTVDDSLGLLLRLDVEGNTLWTRTYSALGTNDVGTFGSSWIIEFLDVAAIGDSGYVVVGSGDAQGSQGRQNIIMRLDSSGDRPGAVPEVRSTMMCSHMSIPSTRSRCLLAAVPGD
ncbi:MAG: hypothetical protein IPH53_18355 [Flavobacteriales bacterium]|nr:hypothetical protein [Flavobacteriales bacterium]